MLFTQVMNRTKIYLYSGLIIIVFFAWMLSGSDKEHTEYSETVKVAIREVGDQLLLSNQDSTSLVLPVKRLEDSRFMLSFQNQLSFEPNDLISIIDSSFITSELPRNYRVEVIQCSDGEVAYSYEKSIKEEKTIIPCSGRFLPENCYTINVRFLSKSIHLGKNPLFLYVLLLIGFLCLLDLFFNKSKQVATLQNADKNFASIGSFQFYPDQNKLVKQAIEISLSKKECELLEIFVANPNQIIKRDELEKRVWEDNGVVVGRSLDTYISKIRKKLKEDTSIKLTNIHGIGYKLELLEK